MVNLIIFDLDGTLLNTLDDLALAGNFALGRHELPQYEVEVYKQFVGDGVVKLVERMTPEAHRNDTALLAALKDDYDAYYKQHSQDCTRPYDGTVELLDALNDRGVTVAVLSNKPHEFTTALCAQYFGKRIQVAFGHRTGYPHKPDKILVNEILELTRISARDCVYVGDSGVDMQTAKNAGVFAAGALWGFRSLEELKENGAEALLENPLELLKLIERKALTNKL